jgi:leucyl aminopeptidase
MRPGDVLASRKGLSIEVGNTDAEGRLILADALTRAAELEPALTIDMATLTGAARVALGPQLPPYFTDDEDLAADIERAAKAAGDPLWRLPRWKPYADALVSDVAEVRQIAHACALARDMVNTPPNDMGPLQLETIAREIAEQHGGQITVVTGEGLLEANYPAVHAVGRAAVPERAPRMIEISWGQPTHPLVAVVGKGVVFDTGGLDIKPSAGMRLMKKDMGGAATMMAVAAMIMATKLPVRLRLLVPAVENSVSGNAFRPLDVVPTRKGISVEIGNTDAEGRLILCDALHEGASEKPTVMIDCATLTGAARVALGTDLPALFCNDDVLAEQLVAAGKEAADPMWRMPLFKGYRRLLDSKVADINNAPGVAFGGAITAALYLQEFVPDDVPWAHFDMMAWNNASRPGRPEGGEAQAARAIFSAIEKRIART